MTKTMDKVTKVGWKIKKSRIVWAFIRPDGNVLADSTFLTEEDVWRIGLGWPSNLEIEEAKRLGYVVRQIEVYVLCDN